MTKLKERFDTLSDAIIAIIMTILVLEITVPHNTTELIGLFEEICLFIISFSKTNDTSSFCGRCLISLKFILVSDCGKNVSELSKSNH